MNFWDQAYSYTPPWDIDQPQPVFIDLLNRGEVQPGPLLDVGCGTGENAIFFARNGFSVTGIDLSPTAIRLAKQKAHQHHISVNFYTENALMLANRFAPATFTTVIDSGLFHTLTDDERPVFTDQLAKILKDHGNYFMLCFADKEHRPSGPRRISKEEIHHTFTPHFIINYIHDAIMLSNIHNPPIQAYFTSATKL